MRTQSLTMINVCTCIRVFPNGWMGERDVPPPLPRSAENLLFPLPKVPKPIFYSAPSKGASPTTE